VIHLPGLRGNPERTYPVAAAGPIYPGTFEKYAASLISQWAEEDVSRLDDLNNDMQRLLLTGGVTAVRRNDVQIEVYVGRTPDVEPTGPENRVNVADVGIGVSQCLPVVVALHAAQPGQLVYIEQPETHLHPRAQVALAQVFATAANRGVRVVVETHSSLLLLGVQALVAKGELAVNCVKLHWFQRDPDGKSLVTSQDLDEAGRFGTWPEDFDDVTLQAQKEFLDAAEKHLFAK
jgi:predicted ATPase